MAEKGIVEKAEFAWLELIILRVKDGMGDADDSK